MRSSPIESASISIQSTTTSTSTNSSSNRKVTFDEIEFLEFWTILGDNPAVSAGAPVALGNELVRRSMMDVEFYEQNRGKRRHRKKLALPVDARARLLLKRGYSLESIASATMAADVITRERLHSANKQSWDRVNEVSERFGRVLKKALMGNKNSAKLQPLQATIVVANTA